MSLEEDVLWLMSICKKPNSLKYLEPGAHVVSILSALQGVSYTEEEIAKLSMVGIIATTARMNNEERFHNLDPQSFLQVANNLLDEEDDGKNYNKLVSKILGETSINMEQEGQSDVKE